MVAIELASERGRGRRAMQEARERQQEMIKTIIKQRDMYRVLATTAGRGGGDPSGLMLSPNGAGGAETSTALVALSPMSPGQAEYAARAAEVEDQLRKQVNDLERQLTRATEERNIMREVKERHESEATTAQAERNELRSEAERQKAKAQYLEERLAAASADLDAARREAELLRRAKEQSDRLAEEGDADAGLSSFGGAKADAVSSIAMICHL